MSKRQFVKTAICNEYQMLLEEGEKALAMWNVRRAEIAESRLGRDTDNELLRLQTKYARAQSHYRTCGSIYGCSGGHCWMIA